MDEFKRFFLRGLAAVLPTLLTVAVFMWAYTLVDTYVGRFVTEGMLALVSLTGPPNAVDDQKDPLKYGTPIDEWDQEGNRLTVEYKVINHPALTSSNPVVRDRAKRTRVDAMWRIAFNKFHLHLVGFLVAIIVVYFVGRFLASFIGRTTWKIVERTIGNMPLVRAVYPNIKQVTDFLFGEQKLEFSGVVAVPYPRVGVWSIGFLTGSPMEALTKATEDELVTIFVPSSPTPMTGYTITVPRRDVVELALSIDEALRFVISAGVIKPHTRLVKSLPEEGSSEPESKDTYRRNRGADIRGGKARRGQ